MKTIEITVELGLVGCKRVSTFEVEDDMTEDEIEQAANEELYNMIQWHWREVEAKPKKGKK